MKKPVVTAITLGLALVGIIFWFFHRPSIAPPEGARVTDNEQPADIGHPLPMAPRPHAGSPKVPPASDRPDVATAYNQYHEGKADKGQVIISALTEENQKPQDLYGKVIDQDSMPVAGATVTGNLVLNTGSYGGFTSQTYSVQTDADGLFQFTGLRGANFSVSAHKDGYLWGKRGEGYRAPAGEKSNSSDRATFVLWKLIGPEPLIHTKIQSRVPYDGTPAEFDLVKGRRTFDGNFKIILIRNPLNIKKGREEYNWTANIEVAGGGLQEAVGDYLYRAPQAGYQSSVQVTVNTNDTSWTPELRRTFYVKTSDGYFGRVFIDLFTNSMRPDTGVAIETWLNPSGSVNLEPSPQDQGNN